MKKIAYDLQKFGKCKKDIAYFLIDLLYNTDIV